MEGVGGSRFPDHIPSWVNGKLNSLHYSLSKPGDHSCLFLAGKLRNSRWPGCFDGLLETSIYPLQWCQILLNSMAVLWRRDAAGGHWIFFHLAASSQTTRMLLDHSQYTRPSALYTTLYWSAGSSSRTRRSWRACLCARRDAWQTCPGNFWGFHLKLGQHGRTSSSHPQNWGGWWHFSCISSGLKSRCCVAFCRMPPNPSIASIKRCLLVIKLITLWKWEKKQNRCELHHHRF
jgi:hypothetical protein